MEIERASIEKSSSHDPEKNVQEVQVHHVAIEHPTQGFAGKVRVSFHSYMSCQNSYLTS
jgi:hypothetical protein